ncbi:MAG: hypothetical protein IJ774_03685 [Selenomonadaceae bacterium]|nr:hypothetical protein [Selenomonadaceae bacterium]
MAGLSKADVLDALTIFKTYQDAANEQKFIMQDSSSEQITEADIAQLFATGGNSAVEPAVEP